MLAHVFCNMMGFPNPGYAMQQFPEKRGREYCVKRDVACADEIRSNCIDIRCWDSGIRGGIAPVVGVQKDTCNGAETGKNGREHCEIWLSRARTRFAGTAFAFMAGIVVFAG